MPKPDIEREMRKPAVQCQQHLPAKIIVVDHTRIHLGFKLLNRTDVLEQPMRTRGALQPTHLG